MPATSPSQRKGSYSTAIIRSHAAYGDVAWGPVVGSLEASSVTPRTYKQPGGGSIAQYGHLSRMAVFGYLTKARDARPRRRRPTETGDELAAYVRDVAVHGMRAQHELLRDLAIAETARDAGQDLALAI